MTHPEPDPRSFIGYVPPERRKADEIDCPDCDGKGFSLTHYRGTFAAPETWTCRGCWGRGCITNPEEVPA